MVDKNIGIKPTMVAPGTNSRAMTLLGALLWYALVSAMWLILAVILKRSRQTFLKAPDSGNMRRGSRF